MTNFERLQEQISDDRIRLIDIEAVPRSISTALGRALNECSDSSLYIHEPFNNTKFDMEQAAEHVLLARNAVSPPTNSRVTIFTKSMARNLTPEMFRRWASLCDGVVWSVRDPLVQIASLLTRIANDIALEPGTDSISQDELQPYLQRASDYLEERGSTRPFSRTNWGEIGDLYRSGYQPKRSVVVDGGNFVNHPSSVLQYACSILDLEFDPRMINGWQGGFINANKGRSNMSDTANAWIGKAASSTGIVVSDRKGLLLDELPPALRKHIADVAIPVYDEMTVVAV